MEAAPESSRAGRTRRATAPALVPPAHDALLADQGGEPAERLVRSFLRGRSARTLDAYRQDLEDFRAFLGAPTPAAAAGRLLGAGQGAANGLALDYKAALMARGLAAATVNRRLAAVRALVKMARTLGLVAWALDVESLPAAAYRDTRGPGRAGYRRLLQALEGRSDARAARDRALLRLLFDLALRRAEVVALDLGDVDLAAGTVAVLGKGRTARVPLTLPAPTTAALQAWMAVRGPLPGPLFTNYDRAGKGRETARRLTGTSLYRIVRALGEACALTVRPHGLRHAAITEALDRTSGDVRAVQRFSRHRDLRVLTVYDDNRVDLAGQVAALVAAE